MIAVVPKVYTKYYATVAISTINSCVLVILALNNNEDNDKQVVGLLSSACYMARPGRAETAPPMATKNGEALLRMDEN